MILNRTNRRINERVVQRLDIHAGDRVLDVGFGGGEGLSCVLERSIDLAAGIEISAPMLRQGRRRFRREIDAGIVELTRGDVTAVPFDDRTFDRVFSVNTIYFWPDRAAGVREILRVLKPGGRLILGTEPIEAMKRRGFTRHGFTLFSEAHLERLLSEAGVVQISVDRVEGWVLAQGHKSLVTPT
jgi:ubiquinone/menaquinone biosynthesis C-methylase UbiE